MNPPSPSPFFLQSPGEVQMIMQEMITRTTSDRGDQESSMPNPNARDEERRDIFIRRMIEEEGLSMAMAAIRREDGCSSCTENRELTSDPSCIWNSDPRSPNTSTADPFAPTVTVEPEDESIMAESLYWPTVRSIYRSREMPAVPLGSIPLPERQVLLHGVLLRATTWDQKLGLLQNFGTAADDRI